MNAPAGGNWYENPLAVGVLLSVALLLVLAVWIVGVGAVFVGF